MNSIRKKIQNALIGSIVVVTIGAGAVLTINQISAFQNKKIIESMAMEYSIIPLSTDLIKAYNDSVKNSGSPEYEKNYNNLSSKITRTIDILKTRIVSEESRNTLLGVENTAKIIIKECDTGFSEIKNNNFDNFSEHFAEAHKNNEFLYNNVSLLLQKELEFLLNNQAKTQQIYTLSLFGSVGFFALMIIFMMIYASSFSKKLISPVEELTENAQKVASGDMNIVMDDRFFDQKDEVGILSRSFSLMVKNIKDKISELNLSNEKLSASKDEIENNNKELESLNKFMVDRELKMVELKNKIAELEGKSHS